MNPITISAEQILAAVMAHVTATLPPERIEALAETNIRERVKILTPEQAAAKLQCANVRQCRDFCREHRIPIIHGTAKKWWVLASDIDDWILDHKVVLPGPGAATRIERAA